MIFAIFVVKSGWLSDESGDDSGVVECRTDDVVVDGDIELLALGLDGEGNVYGPDSNSNIARDQAT